MSEEEIKKISIEYADGLKKWFPDMEEHTYRDKISQAKNVIRLIMRDYCIVPKSKVMEIYNRYHPFQRTPEQVVKDVLEILFREELFDQKGE